VPGKGVREGEGKAGAKNRKGTLVARRPGAVLPETGFDEVSCEDALYTPPLCSRICNRIAMGKEGGSCDRGEKKGIGPGSKSSFMSRRSGLPKAAVEGVGRKVDFFEITKIYKLGERRKKGEGGKKQGDTPSCKRSPRDLSCCRGGNDDKGYTTRKGSFNLLRSEGEGVMIKGGKKKGGGLSGPDSPPSKRSDDGIDGQFENAGCRRVKSLLSNLL